MKKIVAFVLLLLTVLNLTSCAKSKESYIERHGEAAYNMITEMEVNDKVQFGTFEQDNNAGTTDEPITWCVLDKKGNSVLLLSEKILVYRCYSDQPYKVVDPEKVSAKDWLEGVFYLEAFSDEERALILKENPSESANVFLLSKEEVEKYLTNHIFSRAASTKYAEASVNENRSGCRCDICFENYWALRTTGASVQWGQVFYYVIPSGEVIGPGMKPPSWYDSFLDGFPVDFVHTIGIRPAIWISLDA